MFESNATTRTVVVRNEVGQATEVPNAAGWSITDYGTLEVYGVQDESLAAFAQSAWATVAVKPEPAEVSR
jgi:hypothetical protein